MICVRLFHSKQMFSQFDTNAVLRLTEQYDAESRAYVDHWTPVTHPIACRLVEELPERTVKRALDLGAGAGLLLPVIQQKYSQALVVGVDRSEGLLALANRDASLAVSDAVDLGMQTGVFDLVVMAFMLFHLPDPGVGLAEARRVLRPGGLLGLTTWAGDLGSPAVRIWNEELDAHGAVPGESLGRLARHDLMDSPEKVRGLLESAGFLSVRAVVQEFTHRIEPEEFIRLRTRVGGPRQRLESLDENTCRRCVARARERFSDLSADDFVLRIPIVLASAESPC
jgi:ubiquinone/menaquinone biosynthesis C-methylase UbiE